MPDASKPTSIPHDVAQVVFDVAVGSLDFGSGFLDNDEITALRAFAEAIGVDPAKATPSNFVCVFDPPHQWDEWRDMASVGQQGWKRYRACSRCGEFEYAK